MAVAKRILVTGAGGFVGRSVVPALARGGLEVHACGRAGEPHPGVEGVEAWHAGDLLEPETPQRLIAAAEPELLLHLAWVTTPGAYWTSPRNSDWVAASVELARRFSECGGRRMVVAGTCAEYEWSDAPLDEHRTPIQPATAYGRAKAQLHEALQAIAIESLAWARLFFSFGPYEQPERLVPSLCLRLLAGESAPLTSGTQRRDFLPVADVGDALSAIARAETTGAINVGAGDAVAVGDLARMIGAEVGRPELLRFGELAQPVDEPAVIVADPSRLRDEVGWAPRTPLREAVADTVEWWRLRGPG